MDNIKAQELAKTVADAKALSKEFEGKALTPEAKVKFDGLHARAMELKTEIQETQEHESKQKDIGSLGDWIARPAPTTPLPTGPEGAKDGRKLLADRGWEVKGDVWSAPTSRGLQPMYADQVLFGKPWEKSTPQELEFIGTTRAAMQPEYKAAFGHYIQLCTKFRNESTALAMLEGVEQKALSEGTDTAGGFLIPPDYQAEMLVRKSAFAAVRAAGARVQPTSRDILRYPMVNAATATAGGVASGGDSIFSSGFIGSWVGETPAFTDVDASFGLFQIPIKKIRAATKLSNDFVSDSIVDIVAWLSRNGAENMSLVEDLGFLNGDGTALQPKGILQSGAVVVNIAGSVVNTISNTSAAVGSAPKLISLWAALPPQYDLNATFMGSKGSEGAIRKLVDSQNRYLWPIYQGSGLAASARELQGRPVRNSQFMVDGSVANAGKNALIYGDFSNYIIAERAQISTVVLRERFADTDQLGVILFERVGGDVWNIDAFRLGGL